MTKVEIVPTVVPQSLNDIVTARARYSFSNVLHIDFADGEFAPNTTWRPDGKLKFLHAESVSYEAHLMVSRPEEWVNECVDAGSRCAIVHAEAFLDPTEAQKMIDAFRDVGVTEIGLGLLYQTPFEVASPLVSACDFIHLMTIESIGAQGIPYADGAPMRVAKCHARFPDKMISVDGGLSPENIAELARVGARRFCVGSVLAGAENPALVYKALRDSAENAIHPHT